MQHRSLWLRGAGMGLHFPNQKVLQDCGPRRLPTLAPGTSTPPPCLGDTRGSRAAQPDGLRPPHSASGSTTRVENKKGNFFVCLFVSPRQASRRPVEGSFWTRHRLAEAERRSMHTLGRRGQMRAVKPPREAGSPFQSRAMPSIRLHKLWRRGAAVRSVGRT